VGAQVSEGEVFLSLSVTVREAAAPLEDEEAGWEGKPGPTAVA